MFAFEKEYAHFPSRWKCLWGLSLHYLATTASIQIGTYKGKTSLPSVLVMVLVPQVAQATLGVPRAELAGL